MINITMIATFVILISPAIIMAQKTNQETIEVSSSQHKSTDVQNYREFEAYVSKTASRTIQRGELIPLKDGNVKIEKEGVEVSSSRPVAKSKSGKRVFLGSRNRVAVIDTALNKVAILDTKGALIKDGKLSKSPEAKFSFSDSRLFFIAGVLESNGGFEIYDYNGKLIKAVNPGYVGGFSVSNQQAYLALTAGAPKSPEYFLVYDMDGNELFRREIKLYAGSFVRITFSPDDKYIAVDVPDYWRKKYVGYNEKIDKQRKRYVFRVDNAHVTLISEENHD